MRESALADKELRLRRVKTEPPQTSPTGTFGPGQDLEERERALALDAQAQDELERREQE